MEKFAIILLLVPIIGFAQNNDSGIKEGKKINSISKKTNVNVVDVEQMAIYPNCEKDNKYYSATNKKEQKSALVNCFSKSLYKDIDKFLKVNSLKRYSKKNKLDVLKSKVSFIVDSTGRIIKITVSEYGDEKLSEELLKAMEKIQQKIDTLGGMEPAKSEDRTNVGLILSVPIKIKFE